MRDEDLLIMLSDHGFERLEHDVYVNGLLKSERFLKFKNTAAPKIGDIDGSTKAFALDPARIYINCKGKYPCGSVEAKDKQKVVRDLTDIFNEFCINNRKVIRRVYRKEEIYSGPFLEQAPDLVLVATPGFNLKANVKADAVTGKSIFTGKHTQDSAFLFIKGVFDKQRLSKNPAVHEVWSVIQGKNEKEAYH